MIANSDSILAASHPHDQSLRVVVGLSIGAETQLQEILRKEWTTFRCVNAWRSNPVRRLRIPSAHSSHSPPPLLHLRNVGKKELTGKSAGFPFPTVAYITRWKVSSAAQSPASNPASAIHDLCSQPLAVKFLCLKQSICMYTVPNFAVCTPVSAASWYDEPFLSKNVLFITNPVIFPYHAPLRSTLVMQGSQGLSTVKWES